MQHRRRVLMVVVMCTEIRSTMMQMAEPAVDPGTHQAGQGRTHTDPTARHRIVQRPVMVVAVVVVVQVMVRGPIGIGSSSTTTSASTGTTATVPDQILQAEPAGIGHRIEPGTVPGAASPSARSNSTFHHGLWV